MWAFLTQSAQGILKGTIGGAFSSGQEPLEQIERPEYDDGGQDVLIYVLGGGVLIILLGLVLVLNSESKKS